MVAAPTRAHHAQATQIAKYADMVADPCNATLVPGLYGSDAGMLARLKRSIRFDYTSFGFTGATAGYFVWCPDYTNAISNESANVFFYGTTDSAIAPVNTTVNPFGITGSAKSIGDPAGAFLSSDLVSDCRPIGACMTMQFIGALRDSSGEVAFIHNMPTQDLLTGGAGGSPITVDDIFAYTTEKQRLGLEKLENIFKPTDENSVHFRDELDILYSVAAGAVTTVTPNSENFSSTLIGFAWRGAQAEAPLTFDFIKNVEWRAETSAGLGQNPNTSTGPSALPLVRRTIEKAHPQPWLRTLGQGMLGQASNALQQAGSGLLQLGMGHFKQAALSELGAISSAGMAALPLLIA